MGTSIHRGDSGPRARRLEVVTNARRDMGDGPLRRLEKIPWRSRTAGRSAIEGTSAELPGRLPRSRPVSTTARETAWDNMESMRRKTRD